MCSRYLENKPKNLDGEGVVCQGDESVFAYKPKHHQAQHRKMRGGYVHCLHIAIYKKRKIVIVRYKIQVQYNLYIKSVLNCVLKF
jgi:hypothetical protein